jgi:two-component system, chemotaxis family, chemotaxis protein CheY
MANRGPILVVDDEESILGFVQMTLEDEGYEVITADNGAQALDVARRHLPRLILLDLRMPVMSGEEFMTAYRAMPGPHAPIVILTAARDGQKRAAEAAFETHLRKPFDLAELVDLVGKYVT